MLLKAKKSFVGTVCMTKDEIRKIDEKDIADDLISAGYCEKVKNKAEQETNVPEQGSDEESKKKETSD